jgi:hypothetical protein
MVELRSKKSYETASGASSDVVTRRSSRSSKPAAAAAATAISDAHATAEVTSPKRRPGRPRRDDQVAVEDQGAVTDPPAKKSAPMPPPPVKSTRGGLPAPKGPDVPAAAEPPAKEAAAEEPQRQQQAAPAAAAAAAAGRRRRARPLGTRAALLLAVAAALLAAAAHVATQPELQLQLSAQLGAATRAAQARAHALPAELGALQAWPGKAAAQAALRAKARLQALAAGGKAGPPLLPAPLAAAVHASGAWQARVGDVLAHATAAARPGGHAPKALGLLLTCSTASACSAAAAAVGAAAADPRCALRVGGASFPAGDGAAAGRLQGRLAEHFCACPAGLVVLEGLRELGAASVNVLHNVLSEHGGLLHGGRGVHTSGGVVAVLLQGEVSFGQLADEAGYEAAARQALRWLLQQKLVHADADAARGIPAALSRRMDFVLPVAEAAAPVLEDVPAEAEAEAEAEPAEAEPTAAEFLDA